MIKRLKKSIYSDKNLLELLSGSSIAFIFRLGGIGLGYIFVLIVTRKYGAEAMGIFALSFTVLQIASNVSKLGMDVFLLRFTSVNAKKNYGQKITRNMYGKILLVTIPLSIFISGSLYFFSPFIAEFIFHKPDLVGAFRITSLGVFPMTMLLIHQQGLRGLKKIKVFSFFRSVSISLFSLIILIIMIYFSMEKTLISFGFSIGNIIPSYFLTENMMPLCARLGAFMLAAFLSIFAWFRSTIFFSSKDDKLYPMDIELVSMKKIIITSLPMLLGSSLFIIMNWVDTFMLGMFGSVNDIGIYAVVMKVSTLTSIVLIAINSISAPKFAEMWGQKNIKGLRKIVQQSTKLIFWCSFPVLILIFSYPVYFLNFFGIQFESGVIALILLASGQFIGAVSGQIVFLLNMTGHEKVLRNNVMIALVVNILLNYFLIPIYGIDGAAFASLISTIFWNISGVFYIRFKLGFWTIYIPYFLKYTKGIKGV